MDIEYSNIKKYFRINIEYKVDGCCEISECNNGRLLIVKSGIGKELAGRYTEYVIKKYKDITNIFSVGIAGAISSNIEIGDVVISDNIIDYSQNHVLNEYQSQHNKQFDRADMYKCNNRNIHIVKILSNDILINDKKCKNVLYSEYGALCVEIESAGVIVECNRFSIPFTAIKTINDYADEKAVITLMRRQAKVADDLGQLCYKIDNRKHKGLGSGAV